MNYADLRMCDVHNTYLTFLSEQRVWSHRLQLFSRMLNTNYAISLKIRAATPSQNLTDQSVAVARTKGLKRIKQKDMKDM